MKKLVWLLMLPLISEAKNFPEIQFWEEIIPQKGYVLSVDLHETRKCSEIWTKQIQEFKKENEHIKDPNLILINQKIKVQDCRLPAPILKSVTIRKIPSKLKPYVGIYLGGNYLTKKSDDTEKVGHNIGIKLGYEIALDEVYNLGLSIGYFKNNSQTIKDSPLGSYEVETNFINIEAHLNKTLSDKARAGFLLNLVGSEDVSLKENKESQNLGVYVGVESLYKLAPRLDLETNLQQRLDDLSRVNMMVNLGLRFNF